MANGKGILGIIFVILGIIFISLFVFIIPNGLKLFGLSWYSIQYTIILLPFVGGILFILGIVFLIKGRKKS